MYITNLNKTYQIPSYDSRRRYFSSSQRIFTEQDNQSYTPEFKKLMTKIFNRIYPKGSFFKNKQIDQNPISIDAEQIKIYQKQKQTTFFSQQKYSSKRQSKNIIIQDTKDQLNQTKLIHNRKSFKIRNKTPTLINVRNKQYRKIIENHKNKNLSGQKISNQTQSLQKTFVRTRYFSNSQKKCNKLIVAQSYNQNKKQSSLIIPNKSIEMSESCCKKKINSSNILNHKMNFTKQNWNKKMNQKNKIHQNKLIKTFFLDQEKTQNQDFLPWKTQPNQKLAQDQYFTSKKNF